MTNMSKDFFACQDFCVEKKKSWKREFLFCHGRFQPMLCHWCVVAYRDGMLWHISVIITAYLCLITYCAMIITFDYCDAEKFFCMFLLLFFIVFTVLKSARWRTLLYCTSCLLMIYWDSIWLVFKLNFWSARSFIWLNFLRSWNSWINICIS